MTATRAFTIAAFTATSLTLAAQAGFAQTDELPLGQPVELQVGQPYIAEVFDDWQIRCIKVEEGQIEPCQMYQLLLDTDGNEVAEMTVFPLPEGQQAVAGARVITPLETALSQGVQLFIDDNPPLAYGFDFCDRVGCYARMGFPPEMLEDMQNGAVASLRMVPFANQQVDVIVTASLRGFTAAFDHMKERMDQQ